MSQPWMPLYIGDYLGDTRRLTTLQHGAYILLIMDYWRNGGLPDDDQMLAQITGLSDEEWRCVRIRVAPLFQHGWHHKRIDKELERSREKSQKARESAANRWKDKVKPKNADAMLEQQCEGNATTTTTIKKERKTRAIALDPSEFQQFWDCYGHKVDRPRAEKALIGALRKATLERILNGARSYRASLSDLKYIKDPAAWLNGERWNDQPAIMNGHKIQSEPATSTQIFVKEGTQQWNAWDKFYRKTKKGIGVPVMCHKETHERGWYFPTELPPSDP